MNSEKVKEIKYWLETEDRVYLTKMAKETLTLINELESENDTLHTNLCEWRKENEKLKQHKRELQGGQQDLQKVIREQKERIAELEKENAKYKQKLTTNQWVQEIRKETAVEILNLFLDEPYSIYIDAEIVYEIARDVYKLKVENGRIRRDK